MDSCVFVVTTGEIKRNLRGNFRPLSSELQPGEAWIDGHGNSGTHFVEDGAYKQKSEVLLTVSNYQIPADGATQTTIQVASWAGIYVTGPNGVRQQMTEGDLVFSTPEPGSYTFGFDGIEVLEKEVVINAY